MAEYEGPERRAHYGWHLDKRLNIGHITATLGLAVSVMYYANSLEQRIAVLEFQAGQQVKTDNRQDDNLQQAVSRLEGWLGSIGQKLDRLVELQMRGYSQREGR